MSGNTVEIRIKVDSEKAEQAMRVIKRSLDDVGVSAGKQKAPTEQLNSAYKSMTGSVGMLTSALISYISVQSAMKIVQMADQWKMVELRLSLVTAGHKALADTQEKLFAIAQKTRTHYSETVDLYSRIARALKETNYQQQDFLSITDTINKTLVISGASAASSQAALIQLGQAFASGVLRGEELNSVLEQAPRLAEAIAVGMGKTVGELRAMGAAGELTSKMVADAIKSQSGAVNSEFSKMEMTVGQASTKMANEIGKAISEFDKAHGVTRTLAEGISSLSENLDEVTSAVTILAAASLPYLLMQIGAMAKAAAGGVAALTLAMNSNPILLFATGLTLAAAKLYAFRSEVEKIKNDDSIDGYTAKLSLLNKELEEIKSRQGTWKIRMWDNTEAQNLVAQIASIKNKLKDLKDAAEISSADAEIWGGTKKQTEEVSAHRKEIDALLKKLKEKATVLKDGEVAQLKAEMAALGMTKAERELALSYQGTIDSSEAAKKASDEEANALKQKEKSIQDYIGKLNDELKTLGLSETELAKYNAAQVLGTDARLKDANAILDQIAAEKKLIEIKERHHQWDLSDAAEIERVDRQMYDDQISEDKDAKKKIEDNAKRSLEKQEEDQKHYIERVHDATSDAFYDAFKNIDNGWEDLWDGAKDYALKILAELATQMVLKPIIIPVLQSVGGAAGIAYDANGVSGASDGSMNGLLTQGGNYALSKTGVGATVGGWLSNPLWTSEMSATGAGLGQGGQTLLGPSLSQLGIAYGLGNLGYSTVGKMVGLPQGEYSGMGAGIGAAGATAAGMSGWLGPAVAAGGPYAWAAAAVAAILGGVLGSKLGGDGNRHLTIQSQPELQYGRNVDFGVGYVDYRKRAEIGSSTYNKKHNPFYGNVFGALEDSLNTMTADIYSKVDTLIAPMPDDIETNVKEQLAGLKINWGSGWQVSSEDVEGGIKAILTTVSKDMWDKIQPVLIDGYSSIIAKSMTTATASGYFSRLSENNLLKTSLTDSGYFADDYKMASGANFDQYSQAANEWLTIFGQVEAAFKSVDQAVSDILEPLSSYEQGVRNLDAQFAALQNTLYQVGASTEEVTKLEESHQEALKNFADKTLKAVWAGIDEIINPATAAQKAVGDLNAKFDAFRDIVTEVSGDIFTLTRVENARAEALAKLARAEEEAALTEKLSEAKSNYIAALDQEISALQAAQSALESAYENAKSVYAGALQDAIASQQQAQANLESKAADAKQVYIDAIRREIGALGGVSEAVKATSADWAGLADSIRDTISGLYSGPSSPLNPRQKAGMLGGEFNSAFNAGMAGDFDQLSRVSGLATDYLASAKASTANRFEYARIFSDVQSKLSAAQEAAAGRVTDEETIAINSGLTVEHLQSLLDTLVPPVLSLKDAETAYNEASLELQSSGIKDQIAAYEKEMATLSEPIVSLTDASINYYDAKRAFDESTDLVELDRYKEERAQFVEHLDLNAARNEYLAAGLALEHIANAAESAFWQQELGILNSIRGILANDQAPGVVQYADGGISYGPQLAMVSEGRYPVEAHIPLPNGRSVPVTIAGGGGGGSDPEMKALMKELISLLRENKNENGKTRMALESVIVGQRSIATRAA